VASDATAAVQIATALTMAAATSCAAPHFALTSAQQEDSKMSNSKRPWTTEEDQLLMEAIQKYGTQRWPLIAQHVQRGRAGKQCRERWFNHLCPNVKKGDWTEEEDRIIQEGVLECAPLRSIRAARACAAPPTHAQLCAARAAAVGVRV
jgi:hypothetical protein